MFVGAARCGRQASHRRASQSGGCSAPFPNEMLLMDAGRSRRTAPTTVSPHSKVEE